MLGFANNAKGLAFVSLCIASLCIATQSSAAPVTTVPTGDVTGDGVVNAADFQCFSRLNTARQKQLGDMLDSCVSDLDCGYGELCAAFMAPESSCIPACVGPAVVLGSASLETPCEPEDDDEFCLGDIPIENIDLNCDGQLNNADFQVMIHLVLGGGTGPGTPDMDDDGMLNGCDDDTDGDGDPDLSDCAPYDPTQATGYVELCDGIDNDCDQLVDAIDPDLSLPNCELNQGVCAGTQKTHGLCQQGAWLPCPVALYASSDFEPTEQSCDGLDNDCDGVSDGEDDDVTEPCCADASECPDNASCPDAPGVCVCNEGYVGDGTSCENLDECTDNPCGPFASCDDTQGSFTCTCLEGYYQEGDGCEACSLCPEGTYLESACTPESDSACAACDPSCASCIGPSDIDCIECPAGFSWSGGACEDIDECITPGTCSDNATCQNTPGAYTCTCNAGYFGDGALCIDCLICAANEFEASPCTPTDDRTCDPCDPSCVGCTGPGPSACTGCPEGFALSGSVCDDVDECAAPNACDASAACQNTPGAYTCTCEGDTFGDGASCEPCLICPPDAYEASPCTPTDDRTCAPCDPSCIACTGPSPSECSGCPQGYALTNGSCEDVNECATPGACDESAACQNTPGTYTCTCEGDTFGDGASCEPCLTCPPDAYEASPCTPTDNRTCAPCDPACLGCTGPGPSACTGCPAGFALSGSVCEDVDECLAPDTCDENAECTNTTGGYICACKSGYSGDGETCSDIDECVDANPCSDNAACENTPGSVTCSCLSGFYGDGLLSGAGCSPCSPCGDGVYLSLPCTSTEDTQCVPCDPSCLTCSGPSATACEGCADGSYLSAGSCLTCDANCLTCDGSATLCTACVPGLTLSADSTCVLPDGEPCEGNDACENTCVAGECSPIGPGEGCDAGEDADEEAVEDENGLSKT